MAAIIECELREIYKTLKTGIAGVFVECILKTSQRDDPIVFGNGLKPFADAVAHPGRCFRIGGKKGIVYAFRQLFRTWCECVVFKQRGVNGSFGRAA